MYKGGCDTANVAGEVAFQVISFYVAAGAGEIDSPSDILSRVSVCPPACSLIEHAGGRGQDFDMPGVLQCAVPADQVADAISRYGIDPDKADPTTV